MRILYFSLLVSLSFVPLEANSEGYADDLQVKAMEMLINDRIAYEQFLFIGKLRCYKNVKLGGAKHKIDYDAAFLSSGSLNYPIMSLIKTESLLSHFDQGMSLLIEGKKREISLRAEKFYTYPRNGVYICESLHRDTPENKKRYDGFIGDIANYRDIQVYGDYYEGYLSGIIVNDKFW